MNNRSAFSLIEVLVAMAVFALLLVILAGAYSGVDRAVSRTNALREANATGRAALQWITRDLERIRPPAPGSFWCVTQNTNTNPPAATLGSQFLIASNQISTNYLNPDAAFWQVASDEGTGRTMAIIGYFVQWVTETNNSITTRRPVLCRLYLNQTNANVAAIYTSTNTWLDNNLLTNVPGNAAGFYRGWFADNVHSIWFRALDANGAPITTNASSNAFPGGSFDSRVGYLSGTNRIMGPALPASVEVAVIVMNPHRLQGNTATYPVPSGLGINPVNFWLDIQSAMNDTTIPRQIRESLRLYSTRVPLPYAK